MGRTGEVARSLATLPQEARLAFAGECSAASVLADLAVRLAGRTAVPLSGLVVHEGVERLTSLGCHAWLAPPGAVEEGGKEKAESRFGKTPVIHARALDPEAEWARAGRQEAVEEVASGGALVRLEGCVESLSAARLREESHRLDEELGGARSEEASGQAITVLCAPLDSALGRHHLAWASYRAAALLVEPNPDAYLATLAWARPTVVAVHQPSEAAWLRQRMERSTGRWRWRRGPLGRLRGLLLAPGLDLSESDRRFWARRQVRLASVVEY